MQGGCVNCVCACTPCRPPVVALLLQHHHQTDAGTTLNISTYDIQRGGAFMHTCVGVCVHVCRLISFLIAFFPAVAQDN